MSRIYWTKEIILEFAKNYDKRSVFAKEHYQAYINAKNGGFLDELFVKRNVKLDRKWDKQSIINVAKTCKNKSEFREKYQGAYFKSLRTNILDEVCSHMEIIGHKYLRYVYVFIFEDNYVYVGLTYNLKKREYNHLHDKNSQVYKHILKTKSKYIFKNLTNELVSKDEVGKLEEYYIDKFRNENYNILNIKKAGGLGGNQEKWNFNTVKCEALKYNRKIDFYNNSNVAYQKALKNNWIENICDHMYSKTKPHKYWNNIENIYKEIYKYSSYSDLRKNNSSCMVVIQKMKINNIVKDYYKSNNKYKLEL